MIQGLKYSSIICFATGGITYLVGMLFKIMHWPGASIVWFYGVILLALGAILLISHFILKK